MSKVILEFDGIVYDGSNLVELEEWLFSYGYERADNWALSNMQYKNEVTGFYSYLVKPPHGELVLVWMNEEYKTAGYALVVSDALRIITDNQDVEVIENKPVEKPPKQVLTNDNDQIINRLLDIIEKVVTK